MNTGRTSMFRNCLKDNDGNTTVYVRFNSLSEMVDFSYCVPRTFVYSLFMNFDRDLMMHRIVELYTDTVTRVEVEKLFNNDGEFWTLKNEEDSDLFVEKMTMNGNQLGYGKRVVDRVGNYSLHGLPHLKIKKKRTFYTNTPILIHIKDERID